MIWAKIIDGAKQVSHVEQEGWESFDVIDGAYVLVQDGALIVDPGYSEIKETFELNLVRRNRAMNYPPITDYLDGVVKGDQAQIDAYIAACQAVKAQYPKPESV